MTTALRDEAGLSGDREQHPATTIAAAAPAGWNPVEVSGLPTSGDRRLGPMIGTEAGGAAVPPH